MTAAVTQACHILTLRLRVATVIFAQNYSEPGAIDLLGPKSDLPKAISGNENSFLWGPRNYNGIGMIILGGNLEELERHSGPVLNVGGFGAPYAFEHGPIWMCTQHRGWNLKQICPN